jgi:hypothetical protein
MRRLKGPSVPVVVARGSSGQKAKSATGRPRRQRPRYCRAPDEHDEFSPPHASLLPRHRASIREKRCRRSFAQDAKKMLASMANGAKDPAIIPNKKHQVASILGPLMHIEFRRKIRARFGPCTVNWLSGGEKQPKQVRLVRQYRCQAGPQF